MKMKGKAWYIILFFLLVLTACAGEEPEEKPCQEPVQSQPSASPTKEPEGNPIWGYLQDQPLGTPTREPEDNPFQENVLSLPLGSQAVDVTVDIRLSLHECPGLFVNQAGKIVQVEGVRWFHVMADEEDKDYFFTVSEQNVLEQLKNSVFEWMVIPKEIMPVTALYGTINGLSYIGQDEDYYYLARTQGNSNLSIASILVDGQVNEFGNWGDGYWAVNQWEKYSGLSEDFALLENAVKAGITPFRQSPLTTVNSPLHFPYGADGYSEDPYRATVLDEAWTTDAAWAREQLLEHGQDYAYPEELVKKKIQDENEAQSQNEWSMTILETDPDEVIDARAQIYARIKAFGQDVSLNQVIVLLGKSVPTGDARLCSVWLVEDGELVWWDGYFEYFYQDIRPAVSAAQKKAKLEN